MADLAEAFDQHLKSLSDSEWDALVARVRPSTPPPPNDSQTNGSVQAGLDEARRRGYLDDNNSIGGAR